jgi:catechol 2,3-dioxygenase-like lactoylglutathione lyase family enzyme
VRNRLQHNGEVTEPSNDSRIFHVNLNVSDLNRAIEFYALLGFGVVHRARLEPEAVRASLSKFGETDAVGAEFALLRLGDDPTATCLDLVQWGRPFREQGNRFDQLGPYRIALQSSDPASLLTTLADAGIELLGPEGHRSPRTHDPAEWFCVRDPDGTVIEILSGFDHLVTGSAPPRRSA